MTKITIAVRRNSEKMQTSVEQFSQYPPAIAQLIQHKFSHDSDIFHDNSNKNAAGVTLSPLVLNHERGISFSNRTAKWQISMLGSHFSTPPPPSHTPPSPLPARSILLLFQRLCVYLPGGRNKDRTEMWMDKSALVHWDSFIIWLLTEVCVYVFSCSPIQLHGYAFEIFAALLAFAWNRILSFYFFFSFFIRMIEWLRLKVTINSIVTALTVLSKYCAIRYRMPTVFHKPETRWESMGLASKFSRHICNQFGICLCITICKSDFRCLGKFKSILDTKYHKNGLGISSRYSVNAIPIRPAIKP